MPEATENPYEYTCNCQERHYRAYEKLFKVKL